MDILISHHYYRPEVLDEALVNHKRLTETIKSQPGCLYRLVLQANDDPTHVTTLTFWRSKEDAERWDSGPTRKQVQESGPGRWRKEPYRHRFHVFFERGGLEAKK